MNYSMNIELREPTPGDQYNVEDFNVNMEILDEHINNLENNSDILRRDLDTGLSTERRAREEGDNASRQVENLIGVLPITKGGTGASTKQDALDSLFSEIPQLLSVQDSDMFTLLRNGSMKKTTLAIFVQKLYELIKPMIGSPIETGMIIPFAGEFGTEQEPYKFVPDNFLACDGQALPREGTYAKLFQVIGIKYGSGDGITTFNVPDLRECTLVGAGENTHATIATHDTYTLGQFKDDQIQNLTGSVDSEVLSSAEPHGGTIRKAQGVFYKTNAGTGVVFTFHRNVSEQPCHSFGFDASRVARAGDTTHGKQVGVNYIIRI